MNDGPQFRYYKIPPGAGMELLASYKAELQALIDDRNKLDQEFLERAQQQAEYHQANLRGMWRRLSALVGLDPDKTWGSPEYQIEARFIEDGFGAILYMPRGENPFQAALQGEPVTDRENPETDLPPEGTVRH